MGRATVATQMCILQSLSNNQCMNHTPFFLNISAFQFERLWLVQDPPIICCYPHVITISITLGTETGNHLRMVIQQITSQHNCIDITEHYTHWGQMQRLLRKVWQVMSFCHISFCPSSLMYECQTSVWSYKANFIQCESIKFLYNFHYQIKMNP